MNNLDTIRGLVARGAIFIVNHSGGKDSQAMQIVLSQLVPPSQLVVVHAELPGADWPGLREHIESTVPAELHPIEYCRAVFADRSEKSFLGMVADRHAKNLAAGKDVSPWPSPQQRQCTSDLKRTPIEVVIRRISAETGVKLLVNCEGLRAEESDDRANRPTFERKASLSKAGREVYNWLPIHGLTTAQVWETIRRAGQKGHWAYDAGMSRLSCCFCILGSLSDLRTAARLRPETYRQYVDLERQVGKTFSMTRRSLPEVTGVAA